MARKALMDWRYLAGQAVRDPYTIRDGTVEYAPRTLNLARQIPGMFGNVQPSWRTPVQAAEAAIALGDLKRYAASLRGTAAAAVAADPGPTSVLVGQPAGNRVQAAINALLRG